MFDSLSENSSWGGYTDGELEDYEF